VQRERLGCGTYSSAMVVGCGRRRRRPGRRRKDERPTLFATESLSGDIVVTAATSDVYPSEEAAWKGAGNLWRALLDLGYALTDKEESEIGAIRRPDTDRPEDTAWRGKVRMVLHPRAYGR
jgi:hypothetical protein